jgi:hypothetical protein
MEKRVSDAGVARLGHAFKLPKASQSPFFAALLGIRRRTCGQWEGLASGAGVVTSLPTSLTGR